MKITYAELIRAPRAAIQALVADVEQHPRWLSSCSQAAWTSESRGVGAAFRQTTNGEAREGVVTIAEEGRAGFEIRSSQGQAQFGFDFDLEAVAADVTRLTFTMTIDLAAGGGAPAGCVAFFFKLMGNRFEESARRQLSESFASLKRLAEAG